MNEMADESEHDPPELEGGRSDPDTNLILDYLSNKLDPDDAERLEERAKRDKAFRYKLADIVLLKGLVVMATKSPRRRAVGECRRAQGMFLAYLKGRTSAQKTAQLSRHLEECLECELAFERFEAGPAEVAMREGELGESAWRRIVTPGRNLALSVLVVVALGAIAFGVIAFLRAGA